MRCPCLGDHCLNFFSFRAHSHLCAELHIVASQVEQPIFSSQEMQLGFVLSGLAHRKQILWWTFSFFCLPVKSDRHCCSFVSSLCRTWILQMVLVKINQSNTSYKMPGFSEIGILWLCERVWYFYRKYRITKWNTRFQVCVTGKAGARKLWVVICPPLQPT